jgi:cysteine synthase
MKSLNDDIGVTPRQLLNPTRNPWPPAFPLPRYLNPFLADRVDLIPIPIFGGYVPNMKTIVARWMLERAYGAGKLAGIHTVVEATSGNTGASLGIVTPYYGIRRTVAVVERDIAPGKLEQLRLCGVEPVYPMDGLTTVETATVLGKQQGWLNLNQYANLANPEAHKRWTGPHVWEQTEGKISVFAAPLGTTGTVIGVGEFLRTQSSRISIVGVALAPGEAVPGVRTEAKLKQVGFDWQSAIDHLVLTSTKSSYRASVDLIRSGRMFGPSSGLAFSGAIQFVTERKEKGTLDPLRNTDGRVIVAFTCGDGPFLYLDKYSTILDGTSFNPLDPADL